MTSPQKIVTPDKWLAARVELLKKEKELTRLRDAIAAERRELPWVKIEKEYVFDAPDGPVSLADLFEGRSQLVVKHYMMAPGQTTPCVGCAFEADHVSGALTHLNNHDVSYAAVARAPIGEIEPFRRRMGWEFRFVSSFRSDFNYDFNVSFRPTGCRTGRSTTTTGSARSRWRTSPAAACSTGHRTGRSSTPTRRTAAAARSC